MSSGDQPLNDSQKNSEMTEPPSSIISWFTFGITGGNKETENYPESPEEIKAKDQNPTVDSEKIEEDEDKYEISPIELANPGIRKIPEFPESETFSRRSFNKDELKFNPAPSCSRCQSKKISNSLPPSLPSGFADEEKKIWFKNLFKSLQYNETPFKEPNFKDPDFPGSNSNEKKVKSHLMSFIAELEDQNPLNLDMKEKMRILDKFDPSENNRRPPIMLLSHKANNLKVEDDNGDFLDEKEVEDEDEKEKEEKKVQPQPKKKPKFKYYLEEEWNKPNCPPREKKSENSTIKNYQLKKKFDPYDRMDLNEIEARVCKKLSSAHASFKKRSLLESGIPGKKEKVDRDAESIEADPILCVKAEEEPKKSSEKLTISPSKTDEKCENETLPIPETPVSNEEECPVKIARKLKAEREENLEKCPPPINTPFVPAPVSEPIEECTPKTDLIVAPAPEPKMELEVPEKCPEPEVKVELEEPEKCPEVKVELKEPEKCPEPEAKVELEVLVEKCPGEEKIVPAPIEPKKCDKETCFKVCRAKIEEEQKKFLANFELKNKIKFSDCSIKEEIKKLEGEIISPPVSSISEPTEEKLEEKNELCQEEIAPILPKDCPCLEILMPTSVSASEEENSDEEVQKDEKVSTENIKCKITCTCKCVCDNNCNLNIEEKIEETIVTPQTPPPPETQIPQIEEKIEKPIKEFCGCENDPFLSYYCDDLEEKKVIEETIVTPPPPEPQTLQIEEKIKKPKELCDNDLAKKLECEKDPFVSYYCEELKEKDKEVNEVKITVEECQEEERIEEFLNIEECTENVVEHKNVKQTEKAPEAPEIVEGCKSEEKKHEKIEDCKESEPAKIVEEECDDDEPEEIVEEKCGELEKIDEIIEECDEQEPEEKVEECEDPKIIEKCDEPEPEEKVEEFKEPEKIDKCECEKSEEKPVEDVENSENVNEKCSWSPSAKFLELYETWKKEASQTIGKHDLCREYEKKCPGTFTFSECFNPRENSFDCNCHNLGSMEGCPMCRLTRSKNTEYKKFYEDKANAEEEERVQKANAEEDKRIEDKKSEKFRKELKEAFLGKHDPKCCSKEFEMDKNNRPIYEGGMCLDRTQNFLWKDAESQKENTFSGSDFQPTNEDTGESESQNESESESKSGESEKTGESSETGDGKKDKCKWRGGNMTITEVQDWLWDQQNCVDWDYEDEGEGLQDSKKKKSKN